MSAKTYRIDSRRIAHQAIEGEIVIVNLDNGVYYSLRDTGAAIWASVEHGGDAAKIVADLRNRYEAAPGEIEAAVERLLADLQAEEILSGQSPANSAGAATTEETAAATAKVAFVAPVLEKYSDMKDILMLDPIHEVDDNAGWPSAKDAA